MWVGTWYGFEFGRPRPARERFGGRDQTGREICGRSVRWRVTSRTLARAGNGACRAARGRRRARGPPPARRGPARPAGFGGRRGGPRSVADHRHSRRAVSHAAAAGDLRLGVAIRRKNATRAPVVREFASPGHRRHQAVQLAGGARGADRGIRQARAGPTCRRWPAPPRRPADRTLPSPRHRRLRRRGARSVDDPLAVPRRVRITPGQRAWHRSRADRARATAASRARGTVAA